MDAEIRKITTDLMKAALEDARSLKDLTADDIPVIATVLYMSRWELIMKEAKDMQIRAGLEEICQGDFDDE